MNKLLAHIKKEIELSEIEEHLLQSKVKQRTYIKGQYILQSGDISRRQSSITSGKVRTFYLDNNGNEHITAFGIENWWVGDICSFVTQIPAEFNTQCFDTTTVAQTSYDMHLPRYSTTYYDIHLPRYSTSYVKYHEAQTYQRFNLDLEKSELTVKNMMLYWFQYFP